MCPEPREKGDCPSLKGEVSNHKEFFDEDTLLKEEAMRYGIRMLLAGVLALGLCGAVQAAPTGFAERKAGPVNIDVPADWKLMPKELLSRLEKRQTGAKVLLGVQGPTPQGLPTLVVIENRAAAGTETNLDAMSESDFQARCDVMKKTLKTQTGKDVPLICEKLKTQMGAGLYMQMTLPTGGPEVENITLTVIEGDAQIVANATLLASEEDRYLPLIRQIFASIRRAK